jgi:hypothetical protein
VTIGRIVDAARLRGRAWAALLAVTVAIGGAAYIARRHADAALGRRRAELLDRVARVRARAPEDHARCEAAVGSARAARLEPPVGVPPPTAVLLGTPTARDPPPERSGERTAFGPYACFEHPLLPADLEATIASSRDRTLDDITATIARAEADASRGLPSVLADWNCAGGQSGLTVQCRAIWWRPSTGEILAQVRTSTYRGDALSGRDYVAELVAEVRHDMGL